jgi:large subunit ribosomal protein L6
MSRIGKLPIEVPKGVTVDVADDAVTVKGPKGERKLVLRPEIKVALDGATLTVDKRAEGRFPHAMRGTTRALLNNMITGVTQGFVKKLEVSGVGYEANIHGSTLEMKLGFNMPVRFQVPSTVTVTCPTLTTIVVTGIDNQQVGQVASAIRKLRKPEPYKGKGIKYEGEIIKRKAGKAFASGG